MATESLADLEAAFKEWRRRKRHVREAVPAALLERARAAARHHGLGSVSRATKVDQARLRADRGTHPTTNATVEGVARYSRLEIEAPAARPFAELEMPTGLKVRLFAPTEQTMALVSALCGRGGAR